MVTYWPLRPARVPVPTPGMLGRGASSASVLPLLCVLALLLPPGEADMASSARTIAASPYAPPPATHHPVPWTTHRAPSSVVSSRPLGTGPSLRNSTRVSLRKEAPARGQTSVKPSPAQRLFPPAGHSPAFFLAFRRLLLTMSLCRHRADKHVSVAASCPGLSAFQRERRDGVCYRFRPSSCHLSYLSSVDLRCAFLPWCIPSHPRPPKYPANVIVAAPAVRDARRKGHKRGGARSSCVNKRPAMSRNASTTRPIAVVEASASAPQLWHWYIALALGITHRRGRHIAHKRMRASFPGSAYPVQLSRASRDRRCRNEDFARRGGGGAWTVASLLRRTRHEGGVPFSRERVRFSRHSVTSVCCAKSRRRARRRRGGRAHLRHIGYKVAMHARSTARYMAGTVASFMLPILRAGASCNTRSCGTLAVIHTLTCRLGLEVALLLAKPTSKCAGGDGGERATVAFRRTSFPHHLERRMQVALSTPAIQSTPPITITSTPSALRARVYRPPACLDEGQARGRSRC
ncbi:hypothetical protein C8Q70DRAFT_259279 [Cubamyces menziesii]|nr:hypothetical protein C8Q70DRAFT_259279 [Cubamyces menziesii]